MRSSDRRTADVAGLTTDERRNLAEGVASLRAAYGPRWTRVPYGFGDRARRARKILTTGPLVIKPDAADPVRTVEELGSFADETADFAVRLLAQATYLGEVLGADLTNLPLARLRRISRAVQRLSEAPVPEPSWAHPSLAHAASMTLSALGDDLREVGSLRRELYGEFSEDVWTLACAKNPPPVDRWWQCGRRHRVRRRLASVSRHERSKTDVKHAIAVLRRTSELEANIDQSWRAASNHLGYFAEAGIPDVDGAAEALAAMHDLQLALGDRLDPAKVRALAAADAFVCDEVVAPAVEIEHLVAGWRSRMKQLAVIDGVGYSAPQLQRWAADVHDALDVLSTVRDASAPLRAGTRSVAEIFDDVIARDRVHHLAAAGHSPLDGDNDIDQGDQL